MSDNYITFPTIDPVIFSLGPLSLRWYGLMYLVGFVAAFVLANKRLHRTTWTKDQLSDMLFYAFIGVILGGRIGYVFFYQFDLFLSDPLYLFKIWTGGMSFHGGLLGVITAVYWFSRKMGTSILYVGDFVAPLVPVGLGVGRIGNFINAELWGRTTDVPWGIVFPNAGPLPRHPSQLYEALLEGLVLFAILWLYSKKDRPVGSVAGMFLAGYGAFRFIVEYFREPDSHLQDIYGGFVTQGQMLSLPMFIIGVIIIIRSYQKHKAA